MPSSSVSFRISRQAEDLAETLHALSQRLVAMEQRLAAVEVQLGALRHQLREDPAELERLAPIETNIERLLLDCRQLLAEPPETAAFAADAGRQQAGLEMVEAAATAERAAGMEDNALEHDDPLEDGSPEGSSPEGSSPDRQPEDAFLQELEAAGSPDDQPLAA